jgi:hypothetical protein
MLIISAFQNLCERFIEPSYVATLAVHKPGPSLRGPEHRELRIMTFLHLPKFPPETHREHDISSLCTRSWPRPPKNMIRLSSTSMGPHSKMSARLHAPHNGPPPEIVYFTRILNSIPFICGPICTKVGTDTDFRFSTLALEISTSRKGGHDDSTI